MLTRKKPETLAANITITGQLEEIEFPVVFFNRSQEEVEQWFKDNPGKLVIPYIIKHWDAEYELSEKGAQEAESDRPGITLALTQAFYEARRVAIKGN